MNLCEYLNVEQKHLVQKVHLFDKSSIKYPCIVQEKYDGVFCIAILINNEVRIFSRTGKEYLSMNHLKKPLKNILLNEFGAKVDLVIFEAWIHKKKQEIISGYCRDKTKQYSEIMAIAHDCLTFDDYFGKTSTPYHIRFRNLQTLIRFANDFLANPRIILPNNITAFDFAEIDRFARKVWQFDGEGIVIKDINAPYQRGKRNTSVMKLKRGVSFDLEVTDVIESTGKYQNHVGKLVCRFKNGTSILVGTGLIDLERKKYWEDKSLIVGKIIQVNAMAETKNGVLREPTYKGIRYDKECADY